MSLGGVDTITALRAATESLSAGFDSVQAFIQLGLETISAAGLRQVVSHLTELTAEHLTLINLLAFAGILCHVATPMMRTIVPLRISFIFSDVFFIAYGVLSSNYLTLFLYLLLLPINSIRLYQMLRLVKKARISAQGDKSMSWLKPFTTQRKYQAGDILFHKGDPANEMFFTVSGKFLVTEIGVELPPGRLVGELGFLSPDNRRTMTVECTETGEVLTITYDKLLEICFQNPEFGYYFLRVSSERLLRHIAHLEGVINQGAAPETAATAPSGAEPVVKRQIRQDDVITSGFASWA